MTAAKIDYAIVIPSLVGTLLSTIGAAFIVVAYFFLRLKSTHFRHVLIGNLAIADLTSGINTGTSGIIILAQRHDLREGPACTANGFFVQLATQSIDCSMLLITFSVFYVVTRPRTTLFQLSTRRIIILIALPWLFPLTTASISLALGYFHPASGNWCWIQPQPAYLRYVLMHGWRFAFMIAIVAMGSYVRWYYRRHHKNNAVDGGDITAMEIQKAMLLTAYPMYYIILWIPGIANRLAEATGHPVRVLAILQASTKFIGFANAISFGWNEIRDEFSRQKTLEMILGFMLGD